MHHGLAAKSCWKASRGACRAVRCRPALASLPDGTTMSGRSYLTTRRASGTLACTADEFVHPAGLHRLHCAMCLLATAMMLRRRRTQAEAPGLAGVTWLVSLNHRKRWIAAWGQRVHPLPIPCVERVLPATLKRHGSSGRARAYGIFLYKMVPGVSSLRLPSLARRRGRPRKHGLTTYKSKRSQAN